MKAKSHNGSCSAQDKSKQKIKKTRQAAQKAKQKGGAIVKSKSGKLTKKN